MGATDMRQGLRVGSKGKLETEGGGTLQREHLWDGAPARLQPKSRNYPTDLAASASVWFWIKMGSSAYSSSAGSYQKQSTCMAWLGALFGCLADL